MHMEFRRLVLLTRVALAVAVVAAAAAPAGAQVDSPAAAPTPTSNAEIARAPQGTEPLGPPAGQVPAAPKAVEPLKARYQLRVMEGVLESAVQHGIRSVGAQMRLVTPDLIFFGNPARARGFRLEGYGTFFDVDVPTLRPSVAWSVRTLSQMSPDTTRALASLRRIVASQGDERSRKEAEQALKLVELQVGPMGEASPAGGEPGNPAIDPPAIYEAEVKRALIDAMLDYGNTISLAEGDWLSVAARANDAMNQDAIDNVTVLLRIRGGDLHALRLGTLSREEARQRVNVTEY
jgi:hypothetical protein